MTYEEQVAEHARQCREIDLKRVGAMAGMRRYGALSERRQRDAEQLFPYPPKPVPPTRRREVMIGGRVYRASPDDSVRLQQQLPDGEWAYVARRVHIIDCARGFERQAAEYRALLDLLDHPDEPAEGA